MERIIIIDGSPIAVQLPDGDETPLTVVMNDVIVYQEAPDDALSDGNGRTAPNSD